MLDDQIEFLYLMMMVTFTGFGHYPIFSHHLTIADASSPADT
jgi:hypothetical protein